MIFTNHKLYKTPLTSFDAVPSELPLEVIIQQSEVVRHPEYNHLDQE